MRNRMQGLKNTDKIHRYKKISLQHTYISLVILTVHLIKKILILRIFEENSLSISDFQQIRIRFDFRKVYPDFRATLMSLQWLD